MIDARFLWELVEWGVDGLQKFFEDECRSMAFFVFVALDLVTTWVALLNGFRESAPFTYIFGESILVVMVFLLFQKILFFFGSEWLIWRFSKPSKIPSRLVFFYGAITSLGVAVSLTNIARMDKGI